MNRKNLVDALMRCTALPARNCDKNCPYYQDANCEWHLELDALALLEPVVPKHEVNKNGQVLSCGACGAWFIVQKQKFCHECGQAVKWE